jgi:hypothetical protein
MRPKYDDRSLVRGEYNPRGARMAAAVIGSAVIAAALGIMPGPALAATEVRGRPADMQLRTENASIREVLDALARSFKLTYRLPPTISRQVSGLYSGTLYQVLARILDGHDYIVEVSDSGTKVVVLGTSGATAIPPPALAGPVIPALATPAAPPAPASADSENAPAPQGSPSKVAPPLTSFR